MKIFKCPKCDHEISEENIRKLPYDMWCPNCTCKKLSKFKEVKKPK